MTDQDKTDKVIPLSQLMEESKKEPSDDVALPSTFRRFALWLLRNKELPRKYLVELKHVNRLDGEGGK